MPIAPDLDGWQMASLDGGLDILDCASSKAGGIGGCHLLLVCCKLFI